MTMRTRRTSSTCTKNIVRRDFVAGLSAAALTTLVVVPGRARAAGASGSVTGTVSSTPPKYAKNVIVHVMTAAGSFRPPKQAAEMDQEGMEFVPHVMPVLKGTTVKFLNSDNVRHNVFSPDGEKYDLGTWPKGESRKYTFKREGLYRQLCNIHPEMSAFILVLQNPYFAVTDDDGKFSLKGVPPGEYVLRAWSEKLPAVTQKVTVTAGGTTTADFELHRKRS